MSPATRLPAVLILSSFLAWGLALTGYSQAPKGKRYALLVGVRDYRHSKLPELKFTENDVEELAKVLGGDRGKGKFDEIVLLTTTRGQKDGKAVPTADNIRKQLAGLTKKVGRHDLLLIGLAGHGVQITVEDPKTRKERDENFFCPYDARPVGNQMAVLKETMIPLRELFAELEDSGAGVKFMLVDACRNDISSRGARNVDVDTLPRPPRGLAALFSCKSGERAYETDKLGKGQGHGIFFHHVIEGLKGGAENKEGEVTWGSLSDFVTKKVAFVVPKLIGAGAQQTPQEIKNVEGAPVILLDYSDDLNRRKIKPAEHEINTPKPFENSFEMKLVPIPTGSFLMGAAAGEEGATSDESPRKLVEITRPFYLGATEVTQRQFQAVMNRNPSWFRKGSLGADAVKGLNTDDFPVEMVTWDEAVAFCIKLSAMPAEKRARRSYRLPTEAEWEYACRAGSSATPVAFGKSLSSAQANFNGEYPYGGVAPGKSLDRTREVQSYKPNKWGLYDMHGNVKEWCSDWFDPEYYRNRPEKDPPGPEERKLKEKAGLLKKVLRGGSWTDEGNECRSACRQHDDPRKRNKDQGFRVVCEVAGSR